MPPLALGAVLAGLAAVAWATGAVFARVGMQHMGSTTGTFVSLVSGFIFTLAVALAMDFNAVFAVSVGTIGAFAVVGSIQFPLGRFLNYTGIRLVGVARASAILGAAPFFAVILSLIFLGEQLTPLIAVGVLAVISGLALVLTERRT